MRLNKKDLQARARRGKFTVGIIGCGDIGLFFDYKKKMNGALSHFKGFQESLDFEVVALAEHKKQARDRLVKELKIPVFDDHIKMLNVVCPDVIVVATPNETHESILKDLITYKPRIVFCEKPLALDSLATQAIIKEYDKQGIGLMVNFSRRFTKNYQHVKEMLNGGKLGEIQSVTMYYARGLLHNGAHMLDLLLWFFGIPQEITVEDKCEGLRKDDQTISVRFNFYGKFEARLIGLPPSKISMNDFDILGTRGRVRTTNNQSMEIFTVKDNPKYPGYLSYQLSQEAPLEVWMAIPNAVKNIAGWLRGKEDLLSPGTNSKNIYNILDQVKEKTACPL